MNKMSPVQINVVLMQLDKYNKVLIFFFLIFSCRAALYYGDFGKFVNFGLGTGLNP